MNTPNRPELPRTECPSCHHIVPAGEYCGVCGAHLSTGRAHRMHAFAAHPGEHVLHPSVTSTLFPHLPHRHSAPFRVALLVGAVILLIFGLAGLTGPQIAAAALIVPLLYLVYLSEVEVYEDEPVIVIGSTFVVGLLIGIPWAYFTGHFVTDTLLQNSFVGAVAWKDLVFGVVLPLGAQVLMLVGPIALYLRGRYDEALDGFTFGAASALGFTLSGTLVNLWPQLDQGLFSTAATVDNVLVVLARGLLIPFIAASTTGLIAGALWLRRGRVRILQAHGWTTNLWVTVAAVVLVWAFLGLVDIYVLTPAVVVGIYAATAAVLLIAVRVALHHMLLAEAVNVTEGPDEVCTHCHYVVPRMAFCPHCGVATRATPKTGRGRLARATR